MLAILFWIDKGGTGKYNSLKFVLLNFGCALPVTIDFSIFCPTLDLNN